MTKDEYEERLEQLEKEHKRACENLAWIYVTSNCTIKVGDIVEDDSGVILRVERLLISYRYGLQGCFIGTQLTKTHKEHQRSWTNKTYQSNVIKVNGLEYKYSIKEGKEQK